MNDATAPRYVRVHLTLVILQFKWLLQIYAKSDSSQVTLQLQYLSSEVAVQVSNANVGCTEVLQT